MTTPLNTNNHYLQPNFFYISGKQHAQSITMFAQTIARELCRVNHSHVA